MKIVTAIYPLALTAALLMPWAVSVGQSKSTTLPECKIRGKIGNNASANYSYNKGNYSWLTFRFPVAGIVTSGLSMKEGLSPFIEISVKKLKDGKPDVHFSSMLYAGEAISNSTGKLVDGWVSTVTYGQKASTFEQINFRGSFISYPKFATRFGGVGGRIIAPEDFVAGLREGRDLSFSAYNKDNPKETLEVSLDMEDARKYFDVMEQQDTIIRKQAADGTCKPA